MRKFFSVFALLALLSVTVQAQGIKFGVKGGLDITEMKFNSDVFSASNRVGWFVGPTLKVSLPVTGLGLDISALYSQRQAKADLSSRVNMINEAGAQTLKVKRIIIPVNVRLGMGLGKSASIFAFAGPQVGFRVGGSGQSIFDEAANWTLKSSQFSLNLGGGLLVSHLQVTVNYSWDLTKTGDVTGNKVTNINDDAKMKAWQLALAYFF